jgi:hypothetical protein
MEQEKEQEKEPWVEKEQEKEPWVERESYFRRLIETDVHSRMINEVLSERHLERKLPEMIAIERAFFTTYGVRVSLQCQVEDRMVEYELRDGDTGFYTFRFSYEKGRTRDGKII